MFEWGMRWDGQQLSTENTDALPGLAKLNNLVRTVRTPEFAGITFHEVLAKSALNHVPGASTALPFGWTINPYRGCSHACTYCVGAETMVLMGDGRQQPVWSVKVGDEIYGTRVEGAYRRYVKTTVLAHWQTQKRAYRITLADGTTLTASSDHRFLTDRGWKHVTGSTTGADARPHLTLNNRLVGFGATGLAEGSQPSYFSEEYRHGYLAGMIRGEGHLATHWYQRAGRPAQVHQFRLALADAEALDRTAFYLDGEGIAIQRFAFSAATSTRRAIAAIRTARRSHVESSGGIIAWPGVPDPRWDAGFLAGVFDAEGSLSRGVLRISNKDTEMLRRIRISLDRLGVSSVLEPTQDNGVACVRVTGGQHMRQRFLRLTGLAISRKLSIQGMATKSTADLRVVSIEDLGEVVDMYDMTTGTGDFLANGVVAHNCFARPTHTYLDLDGGDDFDRQIIVKVNVAEVLRKELAKPGWDHPPVALGTNTDPYQRAEGRYRLMPGIVAALAESGTPLSILTKGTLLRRDLPLLAEAAEHVPVDLAMSIAVYDDELQQSVEPGTPSTAARLATVTAVREHGLDCTVFLMPILPYLTDTRAHLDDALRRVKEAGASSVLYSALHLKAGVKQWYFSWLEREHPELLPKYRAMYSSGAYAPKEYRTWLAARIRPLVRAHGLERARADPASGGVRSRATRATSESLLKLELPAQVGPPTLF
jgi:DNA repair photolyase